MRELTRVPPSSIEEMKATVEGFADSLDLEEVLKAVENIKKRAQVCSSQNGGHFQHLLLKHKISMNGDN